jgi:hypothetical protein
MPYHNILYDITPHHSISIFYFGLMNSLQLETTELLSYLHSVMVNLHYTTPFLTTPYNGVLSLYQCCSRVHKLRVQVQVQHVQVRS